MKISKINTFLSTLNFVLFFIGYQLATTLFLPITSDIEGISRVVTIPYRAFALIISLLVIIINFRKKVYYKTLGLYALLFYWFILIFRMFYDIYFSADVNITDASQLWMYVFGICLPAVFSLMKSIDSIDLNKSLKWIFGLTILTIFISLLSNQNMLVGSNEFSGRQSGNIALNTIWYGHLGTMGIVLSTFILLQKNIIKKWKMLTVIFIALSAFTMLRAGSRSPIVALLAVSLFWLFAKNKNIIIGILIIVASGIFLIIFLEQVLIFIGNISPVIELRLRASIYEGDTSYRLPLYKEAWQTFIKNPFVGDNFSLKGNSGDIHYSHNIVLDSLMGLGLLGGFTIFYILGSALKRSYRFILNNNPNFWIFLILIQQISLSMFSSAFYYNQLLSALLTFIFIYKSNSNNNPKYQRINNEN